MCRVVAYLGSPLLLDDLLYRSDCSLTRQTHSSRMTSALNLAGFGFVAWDPISHDPAAPFAYHSPMLPQFDPNLRILAGKIKASCAIGHVRGVALGNEANTFVGLTNLHPFRFRDCRVALAHNGELALFDRLKFKLVDHIRPELAARIQGTTDSEWIYALPLSQLRDPAAYPAEGELAAAVVATLRVLRDVRSQAGVDLASAVNLFVTDGREIVATRFTFDFGCYPTPIKPFHLLYHSMWYTRGRDYGCYDGEWRMTGSLGESDSLLIASEPLTEDISRWVEIPEYSLVTTCREGGVLSVRTADLDL